MIGFGRNIASAASVNTRSLRAAKSSSQTMGSTASASRAARAPAKPKASMEGYSGGKSAFVQPNNTGYGSVRDLRTKGQPSPRPPRVQAFDPSSIGVRSKPTVIDTSNGDYNPFRADAQLAKMIR